MSMNLYLVPHLSSSVVVNSLTDFLTLLTRHSHSGVGTLSVDHPAVHYSCNDAVIGIIHLQSDTLQPWTNYVWVNRTGATGCKVTVITVNVTPWAHRCSFGTGPDGLGWHSPGPCLRWCSQESLRSGRAMWVGGSPSEPRRCKPRGPPRHGPAARPVLTGAKTNWDDGVVSKNVFVAICFPLFLTFRNKGKQVQQFH